MKTMWHRVVCLSVFALACGGEDGEGGTDLKQQWLESAPLQYVARSCSAGFTIGSCSVSAVSDGVAVAQRQRKPDSEIWEDVEPPSDVIASILNVAKREEVLAEGCERRVTQHEQYAFPSSVFTSCYNEGYGIQIDCFVADTLDLSLCEN
ncbi:MAG: hypothetical protein RL685_2934 [Pseudomonadota bacterium]|jgi:hypothetical protein